MTSQTLRPSIATALLIAISLSGCVVGPAPYSQVAYPSYPVYSQTAPYPLDGVIVSTAPPPPPRVEVIPSLPFVGAIWISGYWNWSDNRYVWVPGHYARPVPGHRFQPHRWEQGRGGWTLNGGFWVR